MVIIGIGGLTKDLLTDLLQQYNAGDLLFYTELEDDPNIAFYKKYNFAITTATNEVVKHFSSDPRFLVVMSNTHRRYDLVEQFKALGGTPHFFISKTANISLDLCELSRVNTIIMKDAHVSPGTVINEGVIVSQSGFICHDAYLERYVFVAADAGLSNGRIGEFSFLGARSFLLPGKEIGKNCFVGTYSLVTKSMPDGTRAIGIPARIIKGDAE